MDKTTPTDTTPAEDTALPMDELSPDHAELLASWKKDNPGKPAASVAAATATAEEAAAGDPDNEQDEQEDDAPAGEQHEAGDGEADGEEQQQEEEEEGGEEEDADEPGEKSKVQKRIDTLTAQKKDLQAKLTAAQEELTTLKSTAAKPGQPIALVPLPEDPLSDLTTQEAVDAALDQARKNLAWCKANKAGASVPKSAGSSETVELSAEEVEAIREEQEQILAEAPRRKDWLRAYEQAHTQAIQAYPDLFKGAEEKAFVQELLKQVPGLARHPHHEMFIGDALAGAKLRTGKLKAVPVGKKPLPATTAAPAAASSPRPGLSGSAAAPSSSPRGAKPDTATMRDKALRGEIDGDEAAAAMLAAKFG